MVGHFARIGVFLAGVGLITPVASAKKHDIDLAKSEIKWKGGKRFVDSHHVGSVAIKSGFVNLNGQAPKSAELVIDMTKIKNDDVTDAKWNAQLVDHLKSADFFYVEKYPEAKLVVKSFEQPTPNDKTKKWRGKGTLTIRGNTKPVEFDLDELEVTKKTARAAGKFSFDRKNYEVNYRTEDGWLKKLTNVDKELKEKVIHDTVEINFTIVAQTDRSS